MSYTPQAWVDGSGGGTPLSAARLNYIETGLQTAAAVADSAVASGGGTTAAAYGRVLLDSYTGTDDDKLDSALTYAAAQTYPPTITLTNRQYTFSTPNRAFFDGLRMCGPIGAGNAERLGQTKMGCRVHLSGLASSWFTMTGSTSYYGVHFENMAFTGGSTSWMWGQGSGTGSLRNPTLRNVSAVNLRTFLGSQSAKLLVTSPTFDGFWNVNAHYEGAIHIGGSGEGILWPNGGIFDNGTPAYQVTYSSTGQACIWLDGFELANVGPIFVTCESGWEGLRISGAAYNTSTSNNGGPVDVWGATFEGRNASTPCYGSVARVIGGIAVFNSCKFLHGLSSASTMGHTPTDAGLVDVQSSAETRFRDCHFDRYTGQAETVPMVYVRSGNALISGAIKGSKGGTWTGLPRVQAVSPGTLTADATVTVIP